MTTGPTLTPGTTFIPQAGDIPVPGDYTNGINGADQLAVYRPSTGQFFIQTGSSVTVETVPGWTPGDVPVPAEYDNTATYQATEAAVYNPTTGTFYIDGPTGKGPYTSVFSAGDIPAPGDYLGLGSIQPAVYHYNATTGTNTYVVAGATNPFVTFGAPGDIPLTAPLAYRTVPASAPTNLALATASDTGYVGDGITSDRSPFITGQTVPNTPVDLINAAGVVLGTGVSGNTGVFDIQLAPTTGLPNGTYEIRAALTASSAIKAPSAPR